MDIIPAGLDSFSDGEFTDIRGKLRLSSWWKVTGVRTTVNLPESAAEHLGHTCSAEHHRYPAVAGLGDAPFDDLLHGVTVRKASGIGC